MFSTDTITEITTLVGYANTFFTQKLFQMSIIQQRTEIICCRLSVLNINLEIKCPDIIYLKHSVLVGISDTEVSCLLRHLADTVILPASGEMAHCSPLVSLAVIYKYIGA